jgi:WD40 repeat protein
MRASGLGILLGLVALACRSCDLPMGEPTIVVITCAVDGDTELQAVAEESDLESVESVAFDPQGRWLAAGGGGAAYVAFDPQGRSLTAGSAGAAYIWDMGTGRLTTSLPHPWASRLSVALSPDGRLAATAGYDGHVRLWHTSTWTLSADIETHADLIDTIAFSPDSRVIASGGQDEAIRLWDTESGAQVGGFVGAWEQRVRSLAFSPKGGWLACGRWDGWVSLWDVATGDEVAARQADWEVESVAFAPQGDVLVSCGVPGAVRGWAAPGLDELFVGQLFLDHGIPAWLHLFSVAVSPDGKVLATGGTDGMVRLWESLSGGYLAEMKETAGEVYAVAFHPGGRLLATASERGIVRLWDVHRREWLVTLQMLPDGGWVSYTPDAHYVCNREAEKSLRWRVGEEVKPLDTLAARYFSADYVGQVLRDAAQAAKEGWPPVKCCSS